LYQKDKALLETIQEKRFKMIDTAEKNGLDLTNEETLKRSQELDQLIFQYQRKTYKNFKRKEDNKAILSKMMFLFPAVIAYA
jgi:stage 0 sporulation regulatory protein